MVVVHWRVLSYVIQSRLSFLQNHRWNVVIVSSFTAALDNHCTHWRILRESIILFEFTATIRLPEPPASLAFESFLNFHL